MKATLPGLLPLASLPIDISPPPPSFQLYWVSPLTYAQQGLFLNEFTDSRWDTLTNYNGNMIRLGDAVLQSRNLWTDRCEYGKV